MKRRDPNFQNGQNGKNKLEKKLKLQKAIDEK